MTATQPPAVGMRCIRGYAPPSGTPEQVWAWVLAGRRSNRACIIVELTPTDEPTHVTYAYVNEHGVGGPVRDSIENFCAGWRPVDTGAPDDPDPARTAHRELLIEFARWTLGQTDPDGLAAVDALNVGTFESMADKFLDREHA